MQEVDYEEAVAKAPPGWRRFTIADIARLPDDVREREMSRVPPGEQPERVVRAMFWTLVYHLEPERWDELASVEPIAPELVDALPRDVDLALDVGAGSGRLTEQLLKRSRHVIAVEPSAGLREILARRLPRVETVDAWAEELPLEDGCAQLVAACGAFGPDPVVLKELHRVAAPGGMIALISPEHPEWFEEHGWRRIVAPRPAVPEHPRELDDFFGPPDPPHEMVVTSP
jgi:SAM-dependent methyltransferase